MNNADALGILDGLDGQGITGPTFWLAFMIVARISRSREARATT
jgi:hypothetical protein